MQPSRWSVLIVIGLFIVLGISIASYSRFSGQVSNNTDTVNNPGNMFFQPLPNELVQSPIIVRGDAKASWFDRGEFTVKLLDANQKVITAVGATALGSTNTTSYIPYIATVNFSTQAQRGYLVLQKDDPDGGPAEAASIIIPVRFTP